MINRGPVWTSVYHNKCRQQQFSLWRVHLLFPFNKFPASSNFLSVSVVEFYFLNGRQNPVDGKLMNSNPVRKREKKSKIFTFTVFIYNFHLHSNHFFFFFFWNNNRVICRKIYFFISPLLRNLSHLFGQWNMLTVFHCTTVQKYGRRAEQQKAAPTKRILLLLLLFFPFFKQQIS